MDDVWTDWQTDGWISAYGHRCRISLSHNTSISLEEKKGGYELMNSSDWVELEVGRLTPPLDLIGGEVRSLTPPFPPIG